MNARSDGKNFEIFGLGAMFVRISPSVSCLLAPASWLRPPGFGLPASGFSSAFRLSPRSEVSAADILRLARSVFKAKN